MHAILRSMHFVVALALCGCPLRTPNDHYRPHGHQDTTIAISPADDAILFNAAGTGGRDLYRLRLTDLTVTRIVETPEYEVAPSFSPDGQRIVYAAGIPGDRADHIFTIGIDGSSKRQLTDVDANDTAPRFSPDAKMIVFARDKTYNWGGMAANWEAGGVICVIQADGTRERQLTSDEIFAFAPTFSQDGQSVMYFTDYELFLANLNGSGRTQITANNHGCFHPVFAHGGDRVYFLMEEWPQGPNDEPKSSIWMVNTDGTQQKQISDLSLFDSPQSWKSPPSP